MRSLVKRFALEGEDRLRYSPHVRRWLSSFQLLRASRACPRDNQALARSIRDLCTATRLATDPDTVRTGMARWLASSTSSARSPNASRSAKAGALMTVGRPSTSPSVRANSAFVTGSGATALSGPLTPSPAIACRMRPTSSSMWIQGSH